MNFVARVEEQLRELGTEARRKHPGVKEASERAVLRLRTLQNRYALLVRQASTSPKEYSPPTTQTFRSQDVLRPFILACNYPDASLCLLDVSMNGLIFLLMGDAVDKEDGLHLVRVVAIQGNV